MTLYYYLVFSFLQLIRLVPRHLPLKGKAEVRCYTIDVKPYTKPYKSVECKAESLYIQPFLTFLFKRKRKLRKIFSEIIKIFKKGMEKAKNICYNTKVNRYLWKYVRLRNTTQEEVFNVKIS